MLSHTFCHLPRIGPRLEHRIWESGPRDWATFLSGADWPLNNPRPDLARSQIEESATRLEAGDAEYFATRLPAREQWRLFASFADDIAYFDIETTGTAWPQDQITTIALYDGRRIRHFVQGENLDDFAEAIAPYKVVATFNGKCFDGPFIERSFGLSLPKAHIDLRYVLQSLGLGGGLKRCEKALGIDREELDGIDGFFAVLLWREYCRNGDAEALRTLLAYNIADTVNLETLLVRACNLKMADLPLDLPPLPEPVQPPNPFSPHEPTVQRLLAGSRYFF